MNVKLKTKKLKSGKESYYLQYYYTFHTKKNKEYLGSFVSGNDFDKLLAEEL